MATHLPGVPTDMAALTSTLEALLGGAPVGFALVDAGGRVRWRNAGWPERRSRSVEGLPLPTRDAAIVLAGDEPGIVTTCQWLALSDGSAALLCRGVGREGEHRLAQTRLVLESLRIHPYTGFVAADGRYTETFDGPGAEVLLGGPRPPDADPAEIWESRIAPGDREAYRAAMRRAAAGEAISIEYRMIGLDGVVRRVRDRASPRAGLPAHGRIIDGVVEDVTELHRLATIARAASSEHEILAAVARLVAVEAPLRTVVQEVATALAERLDIEVRIMRVRDDGAWSEVAAAGAAATREDAEEPLLDLLLAEAARGGQLVRHRSDAGLVLGPPAAPWGGLLARGAGLTDEGVEFVSRIAEVVSLAIGNIESKARLRVLAATDELTGLPNRRTFEERLARELEHADRARRPLALVLLDIDHFKRVNDVFGHPVGDQVLVRVAELLRTATRDDEFTARVGGEEFALLLPRADEEAAVAAADRLRMLVAGTLLPDVGTLTISCGVAQHHPGDPAPGLYQQADTALYSAKRGGRNRVRAFSRLDEHDLLALEPDAVRTAQVLILAASASANEGMTPLHNERVAELAGGIAARLGMNAGDILRCRVAGLLHDVGKLAIPVDVLRRPGPLTEREAALVRRHVEVGADLVSRTPDVSDAAPAIRHQHERWDGTGFPSGLAGEAIPLDSRILAVADTFTTSADGRPASPAREWQEAIDEVRRGSGSLFDPACVGACIEVLEERRRLIALRLESAEAGGAAAPRRPDAPNGQPVVPLTAGATVRVLVPRPLLGVRPGDIGRVLAVLGDDGARRIISVGVGHAVLPLVLFDDEVAGILAASDASDAVVPRGA